uniref:FHF complex subunit HOOK-interacting protein C-terminal domain-containing protein n=1 Tax=Oryzias sinensis TaxID=183150 RepID=A0A8C7WMR2_9TELE
MNSVCVFVCVCGQVLATGLSGLYSSLPTRLQVYSEDWHCLDPADWQQVPALVHFLHSLDFCSAVTKVAHPSIRSQLLGYIYDGFLVPVLAPALHKLTVEEVMTTTAYLDLFLRSISEPALLQIFLSFILLHTHDNVYILDTLVSRVNTPFQLGTVSLALFRTLIGLFCEDVMLQLVFRYLIPCSHLSRRQRRSLKQRDCYSSSAASFLLLMPSWCPVYLHSTNARSEHIHWPKGAGRNRQNTPEGPKKDAHLNSCPSDLSVSDSVGYCRASDFLMDVNYLHYLWDARHTIANAQRACRFWSAPYDGTDPPAQEFRPDTPGDDIEDEEELIHRIKSDSIFSLVITSPPSALSPTPSSLEAVSNRAGRASSALELEWDDIFAGQDLCLSPSPSLPNGSEAAESGRSKLSPTPPQVLPLHIQEMQRTATKLVHGSYVEESEFLDDVQVYDLVARKDAKSAVLERMRAANQKASGSSSKGLHVGSTTSTVLTTTGKTVMETVNSIMSTRRRSEDEGRDERRKSTDYEITTTSEGYRNDEANNELETILERVEPPPFTNSFNVENHIITKSGDCDEERLQLKQNSENTTRQMGPNQNTQSDLCLDTNSLPNGHCEPQTPHVSANPPGSKATKNSSFLSQYCELMHSLGVEPDCDDMDDHHETFQRRVQALRQKLKEEDEFSTDFLWEEAEEEGETMEEEEEKEEERSSSANGGRRHGVPCTGPFISVLLSRLENLLENSISVNLLLTGILVQLVSYPQPLLRSFLLSTELHSQPSVRTLHQVLVSVHAQIERYVEDRPDYPALVTQAWRFLLAKDQDCKFRECLESQGGFIVLDPSLPNGSLKKALPLPPLSVLPPCPSIPPHAKSRVFAIVLFAEFLKELAAFAQEQSIAPDWWEEFESRD